MLVQKNAVLFLAEPTPSCEKLLASRNYEVGSQEGEGRVRPAKSQSIESPQLSTHIFDRAGTPETITCRPYRQPSEQQMAETQNDQHDWS